MTITHHEVSRFPCGGFKYGPCDCCKSRMDAYSIVTPFKHCQDADGEFGIPLMSKFVCPRCDHELTKHLPLTVRRGLSRTIQHHCGFEPTPHKGGLFTGATP